MDADETDARLQVPCSDATRGGEHQRFTARLKAGLNWICKIEDDDPHVVCDRAFARRCVQRGALRNDDGVWFPCCNDEALAMALTFLQSESVHFADAPHGWPPAAVFDHLRDRGLVTGTIRRVTWTGPGETRVWEA